MRFLGVAAVDAPEGFCATFLADVLEGRAFCARRPVPTVRRRVTEALTSEAAHWVRNEGPDTYPTVSHNDRRWEVSGVEGQDDIVSWDSAACSPSRNPPSLNHATAAQPVSNLLIGCVAQLLACYHPLPEVFCSVRGHCYGKRHLPSFTSFPFSVDKLLRTKSFSCFCSARELHLDGSIPQLIAASHLSEPVTAISPLERREARQLGLLAGQDEYSRIGGDGPLICGRSSVGSAQWFSRG